MRAQKSKRAVRTAGFFFRPQAGCYRVTKLPVFSEVFTFLYAHTRARAYEKKTVFIRPYNFFGFLVTSNIRTNEQSVI